MIRIVRLAEIRAKFTWADVTHGEVAEVREDVVSWEQKFM